MIGVYYLTDGLDVLYVGKSLNVPRRIARWRSTDVDFSQVFVDQCEAHELNALEASAIARYQPPLNVSANLQP